MNEKTLLALLNNAKDADNGDAPNLSLVYCALAIITVTVVAAVRNKIRNTQAASYTKNFIRFSDVVTCLALQNLNTPECAVYKMYENIRSKPLLDNKAKLELLHDEIGKLSADDTVKLKKDLRKMALPMMCRAYIIRELNNHYRQCVREQKHR